MLPRKRTLLTHGFCLALLAAVPVLTLLPVLSGRALPLDLQDILFAPPWQEARPAGMKDAGSFLTELDAERYYPAYAYLGKAAREGRSLLWNDEEGLGMPFLAMWRTRVLSPFSLPFYFFPLGMALGVSVLAKLILAGWCAYYAARRFAFPPPLALLVAVSYQLGAPLTLLPAAPLADGLPWLPLLLLRLERLALGDLRAWPRAALVLGLIALGGSPEFLAVSLLFGTIYLLVRRVSDRGRVRLGEAMKGWMVAVLLGVGLAALQWIPYIEFLTQGGWRGTKTAPGMPLASLFALLSPGFTIAGDTGTSTLARLYHVGFVPVLLLPLWLALRPFVESSHRRQMESFAFAAMGLAAIPLPAGEALSRLPFLEMLGPQHFLPFLGLAFAFLAAGALEEWVRLDPDPCKTTLRRFLLAAPLLWGLYFLGLTRGMARFHIQSAADIFALPVATAAVILVLLAFTLLRPTAALLGYGLALVAGLGLWWSLQPAAPQTPQQQVFPETAFVRTVRDLHTRIAGPRDLRHWPLSCQGIRQVYATGGAYLDRHEDFLRTAERSPLLLQRTGAQALLLTSDSMRGAFAQIRDTLHVREVFTSGAALLEAPVTQPRARMIHAARAVTQFDPRLLSPDSPPLLEGGTLPEKDDGPVAEAAITEDTHGGRIVVHVAETRPGMLVLADAFYPGWKAEVDGIPAPIHAVDGIFRGVEVGMGTHEVIFRYNPMSLRLGELISLAALLVVGFNLLPAAKGRKRNGRSTHVNP